MKNWLKAETAMGEVMHDRVQEALRLIEAAENCKSKLSALRCNCPNFEPKEDAE
jgi:hypothetical protein